MCRSAILNIVLVVLTIMGMHTACNTKSVENTAAELAQWRGNNRDGIYYEKNLLDSWPENGPELLWTIDGLGNGYAAPSVMKSKVFINGEKDSTSYLFAYDTDGNLLWEASNGKEFMGEGFSSTYPGSRSTPTVVDNLVYTSSGKGRIACFDAETGTEKWAVHIVKDLGGLDSYFGYSESLVVDKDKVYCFPGGSINNTVALDRFTGEIVWSNKAVQDTFSYCSPLLIELPKRKVLITHSRHFLYALDAENGNALGTYFIPHYEYDGEHCNSPLFSDEHIYFVGNEKEDGAVKLSISPDGKIINRVWQNSKIKNNFNGYVKNKGHLFVMVKGNWLKALDEETGHVNDSVKVANGSIIFADNKYFCYGMNGDVNLLTYNENEFELKGNFKLKAGTGHHFSHPVLSNGVLYVRHGNALAAYKVAKEI